MANAPTPRDLDPKFKDANPPEDSTQETTQETTPEVREDEHMIVHKQRFIDQNGVQQEKVHGPMPVSDWPAYEKEHKL